LDFVGCDETLLKGRSAVVTGGRLVVVGGAPGSMIVGKGKGLLRPVVKVLAFGQVPGAYERLHDATVTRRLVVVPEQPAGAPEDQPVGTTVGGRR